MGRGQPINECNLPEIVINIFEVLINWMSKLWRNFIKAPCYTLNEALLSIVEYNHNIPHHPVFTFSPSPPPSLADAPALGFKHGLPPVHRGPPRQRSSPGHKEHASRDGLQPGAREGEVRTDVPACHRQVPDTAEKQRTAGQSGG